MERRGKRWMNCEGDVKALKQTRYRGKKTMESSLITSTAPCWVISPSQRVYCSCSLHHVWAVTGKYCVTWLAQMTREQLALCFIAPVKIILMFWHSRERFNITVVYWGKHLGLSLYHNLLVYFFFSFFSSVFWNCPNFWGSRSIFSCCCFAHTKRSLSSAY